MSEPITSTDPDGLGCYSDHAHDIETVGECSMCTSTDPNVVGHVLPDVARMKDVDPVDAARMVVADHTARMFDGILLDLFSAQYVVAVAAALSEANLAKLRAMSLPKAVDVCFKLANR